MRKHYFLILPFLIACFSLQVSAQVNLQQGLVAYYPFNGNANDESGNGNHGTVLGAILTADRLGNDNSAYYFNGSSRIRLNQHFLGGAFTLAVWIKVTENQPAPYGTGQIFSNGVRHGNWGNGFHGHISTLNQYVGMEKNRTSLGFNFYNPSPIELNDNTFHFLVFTWNGAVGANSAKIYHNGNLIASSACASSVINSTKNLELGFGTDGGANYPFKGVLDDVWIFNRVLNEQEIYALYTEGQPPQSNSISNILINQRNDGSGMVDVYYSLNGTGSQYNIVIEASFDGGNTYTAIPASFLSGDVSNISPGTNKHIIWDGLGSHPNTYSTATKLKIIAN